MGGRSPEIKVKPALIRWARTTSGWSVHEISNKLGVTQAEVHDWESGGRHPTLRHLELFAENVKRPLSAFFLPKPPKELPPPADFRVLPHRKGQFEKGTYLAIRRATRLQSIARDLMESLNQSFTPNVGSLTLGRNPEKAARLEREKLGISLRRQLNWRSEWQALSAWQEAVERRNILVFRLSMPLEDVRGFSLTGQNPFAIVVNNSDAVRARIFTLFHEYAHLVLQRPGICIPQSRRLNRSDSNQVELWCNRFAGAFLVPEESISQSVNFQAFDNDPELLQRFLSDSSRRLKVSRQVVLRRMRNLELLSSKFYWKELGKLESQFKKKKKKSGGGGQNPADQRFRETGRRLTSLILESRAKGLITYRDVGDFLSLRVRHVERVQALLSRQI